MADFRAIADAVKAGRAKVGKTLVNEALAEGANPEALLNEGLVVGMNELGIMFKNNEVYVPEVLIAARAMKAGTEILKPLLAAVLCGAAAWASNGLLGLVMSKRIATALAICVAAIIYVFALFLLKAIRREEILILPKGQKIAQTLEKHGWIG